MSTQKTMVETIISEYLIFEKTTENISQLPFEGYELQVLSYTPTQTILLNEYMDDDVGCYYEDEYILTESELNYHIITDIIHNVLVKEKTKIIDIGMEIEKMLFNERAFLLTSGTTIPFEEVYSYIRTTVATEINIEITEKELNLFERC